MTRVRETEGGTDREEGGFSDGRRRGPPPSPHGCGRYRFLIPPVHVVGDTRTNVRLWSKWRMLRPVVDANHSQRCRRPLDERRLSWMRWRRPPHLELPSWAATHPRTRYVASTTCRLDAEGNRCSRRGARKSSMATINCGFERDGSLVSKISMKISIRLDFPCVFFSIRIGCASKGPHRGIFSLGLLRLILASFVDREGLSFAKRRGFQTRKEEGPRTVVSMFRR